MEWWLSYLLLRVITYKARISIELALMCLALITILGIIDFLLIKVVRKCIKTNKKRNHEEIELRKIQEEDTDQQIEEESREKIHENQNSKIVYRSVTIPEKLMISLILFLELLIYIMICLMLFTFIMFETNLSWLIILLYMILYSCLPIIAYYRVFSVQETFNISLFNVTTSVIKKGLLILLLAFTIIVMMLVSHSACACNHNFAVPGFTVNSVRMSTSFTRKSYESSCSFINSSLCHIYATLPENAQNEVYINIHAYPESIQNQKIFPKLSYKWEGFDGARYAGQEPTIGEYMFPDSFVQDKKILTFHIKSIPKDAIMMMKVETSNLTHMFTYKVPDGENMRLLVGGDVGNDKSTLQMHQNTVEKLDYDIILIGGDIAYDNNMPFCYKAWDYIIKYFPNLKEDKFGGHRIFPFIFAMGNHDLGVDSYTGLKLTHDIYEPVIKHWFPQNSYLKEVPLINQRKSYFAHEFNEILVLSLDAGYEVSMEGEQLQWMEDTLKSSNAKLKIVQYHPPIVAGYQQNREGDLKIQKIGKEKWLPLFDKYNVTIVSENHSHVLKRSKRLDSKLQETVNGTLYIGEGAYGFYSPLKPLKCEKVIPGIVCQNNHAKVSQEQNVWLIHKHGSKVNLTAYNEKHTIIDEFELHLN
ncbi:unnamed protein product [Moneuplotes crassus]|uniref:Calcineurin-like phosphoesterase domain-containing protein n=1 Tax=Euplotes crassus TaxID=5936 RepID=A0AAD1X7Z3_EUPCR|nr:unnamed protein product [Moneuplotes crassus]